MQHSDDTTQFGSIALLVADQFDDADVAAIRAWGVEHSLLLRTVGIRTGSHTGRDGIETIDAQCTPAEIDPADTLAVVIPGGWAPDRIRQQKTALLLVQRMFEAQRAIGALGHAGSVLLSAGLVPGRRLTSARAIRDDLRCAGADWVNEPSVVDGRLVTCRSVDDLPRFFADLDEVLAQTPLVSG